MNFFGGKGCHTRVPKAGRRVFLTFDDGPNETFTPRLLAFLAERKVHATFFLVAERARRLPALTLAHATYGHSLGNHSLDHRYSHFFRSATHLERWIEQAQEELTQLTGQEPVAFRSPAGVRTPELRAALVACRLPLVHWSHRYYDTVFDFTERKARRAASRLGPGDILLLHDVPHRRPDAFLRALDLLIASLRARGLEPSALRKEDLRA